jgi:Asp-tRNA(Asn)/Glu-tRNA(Gln) amidotransferase A subunit family amidase
MLGGAAAEEPKNTEDGPVDQPVAAMREENAKLIGRVSALEDYRSAAEREKVRQRLYSDAVKKLEGEGFALSESSMARLLDAASEGPKTLDLVVASYRETGVQDPPDRMLGGPAGEQFPAEVMAFANQSPEKFKTAQDAYREWRTFPDDKFRSPLASYLKREVI